MTIKEKVSGRRPRASERLRYRMKELCELTGLERQTIHFYIQEGLVPEGKKTGRNMAYYDDEHLARLKLVRQLQEEQFLPLRAIKAILGGRPTGFSSAQRQLISDVKSRLGPQTDPASREADLVPIKELSGELGVPAKDVEELVVHGLLHARGEGPKRAVRREDAWIATAWAELSRAGLSRERGFSPAHLVLIDQALTDLFARERDLFFERLASVEPEELARIIERVLPILADLVGRLHTHKAKGFFALATARAAS